MFFTLIIPTYNCQETIDRLFVSIVNQNFNDLKVIVIDDSDEDKLCQSHINKYRDKLKIDYFKRRSDLYNIHCPGNTRHDGLRRALENEDTQYILFADCDDEFLPDSFSQVYKFITENNYPSVVVTPFYRYHEDEPDTPINLEAVNISWMHGKFYKKEFLQQNNIQFKVNLETHEDTFFNVLTMTHLVGHQQNFTFFDKNIYKWYLRKKSTSHTEQYLDINRNYLLEHYEDWFNACMMPLEQAIIKYPNNRIHYNSQACHNLALGYLYFQGFIYYYKKQNFPLIQRNYQIFKKFLIKIITLFELKKEYIILYVNENPNLYNANREDSFKGIGGPFVEEISFKDFINSINIYEN